MKRAGADQNRAARTESDGALQMLPIERIRSCEHNPRRQNNPEYDRIKASIRAHGMDQPLVVTQRPGNMDYVIQGGGNTRLRILTELYAETRDARFAMAECIVRPQCGKTASLLAHLRENDLRGGLSFLDKAQAVYELKSLIEAKEGTAVTQTRLAELLRDRGYGVSQGLISQMSYTVETLLPLLPQALGNGMGRPQVERIRALQRAARTLWSERGVDSEAEFDVVFAALCRRYDAPDWDNANLRRALEAEIAERGETSIQVVSMELEGYLAAHQDSAAGSRRDEPTEDDTTPDSTPRTAKTITAVAGKAHPAGSHADQMPSVTDSNTHAPSPNGASDRFESKRKALEHDTSSRSGGDVSPLDDEAGRNSASRGAGESGTQRLPTDVKSLRARAWTLASRLAQRNGLGEIVQPLSGQGLGFVLSDVPDPALVEQLDEDTLAQVSMLWWHLAAAAELTVAPTEHLLPALAEGSVLHQALADQDAGLLFSSVWTLDPGHAGYRLWRRLDAPDWGDLVHLMETYRALHQAAEATGEPLWR
jgi:ParB family protein of integrating conjugative element (PFGI_1 class)